VIWSINQRSWLLLIYLYTTGSTLYLTRGLLPGKLSGKIYSNNGAITELINQVYARYTLANALHADVFSSVRRFEAEIIRMTARIMRGDQDTCGVVTSGGTDR
jgi:hypothetical protein